MKAEYINHMGDDLTVVNAARVSFDKESELVDIYGYEHPDNINDYKNWQPKFATYDKWDNKEKRRKQAIIEMVSEAGEVLQLVQKANRKGSELPREKVLDELGDTLWGLVGVMNEFNISWHELCSHNMDKLNERNK